MADLYEDTGLGAHRRRRRRRRRTMGSSDLGRARRTKRRKRVCIRFKRTSGGRRCAQYSGTRHAKRRRRRR